MVSPNSRTINVSQDLYDKLWNIASNSDNTLFDVSNAVIYSGLKSSPNGKNETHSQILRWSRFFKSLKD